MTLPTTRRRPLVRAGAAVLALGLVAVACGNDDKVQSSVAEASQDVAAAEQNPTSENLDEAEKAVAEAADNIRTRYDAILATFDEAADKIAENNREAYAGFRNQLATVEGNVVQATEATGSARTDAWNDARSGFASVVDAVHQHDVGSDQAAADAFDTLVRDLDELGNEIATGLGTK